MVVRKQNFCLTSWGIGGQTELPGGSSIAEAVHSHGILTIGSVVRLCVAVKSADHRGWHAVELYAC